MAVTSVSGYISCMYRRCAFRIWHMAVTLVLDISRVCIEGLRFVYGSHVGPGYTFVETQWRVGGSYLGWPSHVGPWYTSCMYWRSTYRIWQSRWAWIGLVEAHWMLAYCRWQSRMSRRSHWVLSYWAWICLVEAHSRLGAVTLVLDISRVCIEGLHIVYGSHVGLE